MSHKGETSFTGFKSDDRQVLLDFKQSRNKFSRIQTIKEKQHIRETSFTGFEIYRKNKCYSVWNKKKKQVLQHFKYKGETCFKGFEINRRNKFYRT